MIRGILVGLIVIAVLVEYNYAFAKPSLANQALKVESFVDGLSFPTSMAFIDNDNLIILEKDGNVRLVTNGQLKQEPLLILNTSNASERGLLGVAVMNSTADSLLERQNKNGLAYVFLYFTEQTSSGGEEKLRNRVYRYEWNGQTLQDPTLILDLPAIPGPDHNGGKLLIGADSYLYTVIGDLNPPIFRDGIWQPATSYGILQNSQDGPDSDDTGVIFRVNPMNGSGASNNPFSGDPKDPLSRYYAYGIRNSFGLDFDPVTGNLWDTENGADSHDEINLIRPGFNSGWSKIMGPVPSIPNAFTVFMPSGVSEVELVNLKGSHYSDPVVTWGNTIGVTDIEFFSSSKLGENYTNNIFVGDYKYGNLYFFKLNATRDGLIIDPKFDNWWGLSNKDLGSIKFGAGFAAITDIETGPDGLLYVLDYGSGTAYKISKSLVLHFDSNISSL